MFSRKKEEMQPSNPANSDIETNRKEELQTSDGSIQKYFDFFICRNENQDANGSNVSQKVSGVVYDSKDGKGITGAIVHFSSNDSKGISNHETVRTDINGNFTFHTTHSGRCTISLEKTDELTDSSSLPKILLKSRMNDKKDTVNIDKLDLGYNPSVNSKSVSKDFSFLFSGSLDDGGNNATNKNGVMCTRDNKRDTSNESDFQTKAAQSVTVQLISDKMVSLLRSKNLGEKNQDIVENAETSKRLTIAESMMSGAGLSFGPDTSGNSSNSNEYSGSGDFDDDDYYDSDDSSDYFSYSDEDSDSDDIDSDDSDSDDSDVYLCNSIVVDDRRESGDSANCNNANCNDSEEWEKPWNQIINLCRGYNNSSNNKKGKNISINNSKDPNRDDKDSEVKFDETAAVHKIFGVIYDRKTGIGMEKATIHLVGIDILGINNNKTVRTDINGNFIFHDLQYGRYTISLEETDVLTDSSSLPKIMIKSKMKDKKDTVNIDKLDLGYNPSVNNKSVTKGVSFLLSESLDDSDDNTSGISNKPNFQTNTAIIDAKLNEKKNIAVQSVENKQSLEPHKFAYESESKFKQQPTTALLQSEKKYPDTLDEVEDGKERINVATISTMSGSESISGLDKYRSDGLDKYSCTELDSSRSNYDDNNNNETISQLLERVSEALYENEEQNGSEEASPFDTGLNYENYDTRDKIESSKGVDKVADLDTSILTTIFPDHDVENAFRDEMESALSGDDKSSNNTSKRSSLPLQGGTEATHDDKGCNVETFTYQSEVSEKKKAPINSRFSFYAPEDNKVCSFDDRNSNQKIKGLGSLQGVSEVTHENEGWNEIQEINDVLINPKNIGEGLVERKSHRQKDIFEDVLENEEQSEYEEMVASIADISDSSERDKPSTGSSSSVSAFKENHAVAVNLVNRHELSEVTPVHEGLSIVGMSEMPEKEKLPINERFNFYEPKETNSVTIHLINTSKGLNKTGIRPGDVRNKNLQPRVSGVLRSKPRETIAFLADKKLSNNNQDTRDDAANQDKSVLSTSETRDSSSRDGDEMESTFSGDDKNKNNAIDVCDEKKMYLLQGVSEATHENEGWNEDQETIIKQGEASEKEKLPTDSRFNFYAPKETNNVTIHLMKKHEGFTKKETSKSARFSFY